MGLLVEDNEWHQALEEVDLWASGQQLRDMFVSMLLFCEAPNPRQLWCRNPTLAKCGGEAQHF